MSAHGPLLHQRMPRLEVAERLLRRALAIRRKARHAIGAGAVQSVTPWGASGSGATLSIRAGNYPETLWSNKHARLQAEGGPVRIGP